MFVQFVVDKSGKLTDIKVAKGLGHGCDAAAVKALEKMPEWHPAYKQGRPVKQRMVIPIVFAP